MKPTFPHHPLWNVCPCLNNFYQGTDNPYCFKDLSLFKDDVDKSVREVNELLGVKMRANGMC